jgi:tRNA(Ile)-lysidine synthetase-like protein
LRRASFERLPGALRPHALDALRRAAGAPYPAPQRARRELDRQLAGPGAVGCHCGDGWSWRAAGPWLEMRRLAPREVREFSYTLRVPGELFIPEVGLTLHVEEGVQAPWMFQGSKSRAAMSLPLEVGQKVLIRNRRPGDRLRPLGCRGERKLKDVLIDKHIGRAERDVLPLLVVEDRIAWVPGVTIDHGFRLAGNRTTWIAELTPTKAGREP